MQEQGGMPMSGRIRILAGTRALARIRDEGLKPEAIDVIAGAAGGPKWLVLGGLDRALFSSWLTAPDHPVFLIGSSIGAWRFAAIAQGMGGGAYDRFERAYIDQHYSGYPSAAEVTLGSVKVMDEYLDQNGAGAVLGHAFFRLSLLAVRSRGVFARDSRLVLGPAMILAWLANAVNRKSLGLFFSRTLFSDPRDLPPFSAMDGFPLQRVGLTEKNLKAAILASGSIPLIMEGVRNIEGAPPGTYRDGGILDYHLDIPFNNTGIVLFPHYTDRIVPGWLDKKLSRRKPDPANMENVVVVCPSRAFISSLPYGRVPDRDDFMRFKGRDAERRDCWERTVAMSRAWEKNSSISSRATASVPGSSPCKIPSVPSATYRTGPSLQSSASYPRTAPVLMMFMEGRTVSMETTARLPLC